jgi:hypothetical protein
MPYLYLKSHNISIFWSFAIFILKIAITEGESFTTKTFVAKKRQHKYSLLTAGANIFRHFGILPYLYLKSHIIYVSTFWSFAIFFSYKSHIYFDILVFCHIFTKEWHIYFDILVIVPPIILDGAKSDVDTLLLILASQATPR